MIPFRDIVRLLSNDRDSHREIEFDTDYLLTGLIASKNKWGLFNLAYLLILTLGCIILMINLAIFLIHDVILFRNELSVNRYGTLIPTKACDCEQAIFMFNTSDLWSNTGIQLRKGDQIKFSASGAFHSSLSDVERATRNNSVPTYRWIGSHLRQKALQLQSGAEPHETYAFLTQGNANAIDRDSYIGAILYQIRPDAQPCRSDWTQKKNPEQPDSVFLGIRRLTDSDRFQQVEHTGILYLAVNDIYLNDSVINRFDTSNRALIGSITPEVKFGRDSLISYPNEALENLINSGSLMLYHFVVHGKDSLLSCCGPEFRRYFARHRTIWYNDNLGQIALSIEIQRQISPSVKNLLVGNKYLYRIIETNLFETLDRAQNQKAWYLWVILLGFLFLAGCLLFTAIIVSLTALVVYSIIFLFDLFGKSMLYCYSYSLISARKLEEKIRGKN